MYIERDKERKREVGGKTWVLISINLCVILEIYYIQNVVMSIFVYAFQLVYKLHKVHIVSILSTLCEINVYFIFIYIFIYIFLYICKLSKTICYAVRSTINS